MINKNTLTPQVAKHGPIVRCLVTSRPPRASRISLFPSYHVSTHNRGWLLPSCLPPGQNEKKTAHEKSQTPLSVDEDSKGWLSKFSWNRLTLQQRCAKARDEMID
eukprot:1160852-Pelagomonas_calceolata.AAC.2